ncbi:apolipoprotein L domain-containing protein 1, partial [Garra rufa]|uniref:apolipoprotein L domain-containing protein 1 n=1 Tax=Garra rufa TaxID=137080 RepID=UPI003CCE80AD
DPGIIMGMIQKLNPFRFSSQNKSNEPLIAPAAAPADEKTQDHGGMRDHLKSTAQLNSEEVQTTESDVIRSSEGNPLDNEDDEDGLLAWWRTVEGWGEWNESKQFNEEDGQRAIESAANRVFMAAKLFVHLLTQREASLQHRIGELLALADAADSFHKKTVTASVGGGVASVAGSITTITGLVLAPFTFGTSLIVTAVGIGVATAGGVTSASANITDTVHSNTDRKKVEKMIQDYQHEIKDIKECLDFLK